jgi:hypothetical protein
MPERAQLLAHLFPRLMPAARLGVIVIQHLPLDKRPLMVG